MFYKEFISGLIEQRVKFESFKGGKQDLSRMPDLTLDDFKFHSRKTN